MTKQTTPQNDSLTWFSDPDPVHLVHFYPYDKELLTSLVEYFGRGLEAGDTCVIIAAPAHLAKLNAALRARGVDINAAIDSGQYVMSDAHDMLASFMVGDRPNHERFMHGIGRIVKLAAGRGRPIRAFGEMVALLWERGNFDGLVELERYWHDLVAKQSFSLYCAYPKSLFDGSDHHRAAIDKICSCHSLALGAAAV